tara:strand:+ start:810 stop:1034 length:225 start_codon:yes stop_codon:yes gene_type:complete
MYDPNNNRFDIRQAETMLGMQDEDISTLKMMVSVDLLCAFAGITNDQVEVAYEARVKSHIEDAVENLKSVLNEE